MIQTIKWEQECIAILDQRRLPHRTEWIVCRDLEDVISAIKGMAIRGAPAIGIAAAMGLALQAQSITTVHYATFVKLFSEMAHYVKSARPTAVNLLWAVEEMVHRVQEMQGSPVDEIKEALREECRRILKEDIEINRMIGYRGLELIPDKATILTHCNAGSLATGGYGTALGVVRAAHEAGKDIHVIVGETRPLLQGLRLTAFELDDENIPFTVIVDSAAGHLMHRKIVDLVITGADRIASNGDTANKIGTYQTAVLAKENRIPFYIAAPLSTFDRSLKDGAMIPIEERDPEEVLAIAGHQLGPEGVTALNPAFDITPARYISAMITEKGIIKPPYRKSIRSIFTSNIDS